MILGIGLDIVDLHRFKDLASNKKFVEKYFHKSESELNDQSLAGRFAAREALYKALNNKDLYNLDGIEIINESDGSPKFVFYHQMALFLDSKKIHLSISHLPEYAIALVIIEEIK
jgi:holo-[acyl-carrier protein] synthase